MDVWEYKVVRWGGSVPPSAVERDLQALGREGWEAFSTLCREYQLPYVGGEKSTAVEIVVFLRRRLEA